MPGSQQVNDDCATGFLELIDERLDARNLIHGLASDDSAQRERSRRTLVEIGTYEVTTELVGELSDPRDHVRWEAAKALVAIGDPIAAPALLQALDDENADVRWVAAEGLIVLGRIGLLTVLHGLTKQARSVYFCRSAHHVLHELARRGYSELVFPVLAAMHDFEPAVAVPLAAFAGLMALKVGPDRAVGGRHLFSPLQSPLAAAP